MAERGRVLGGLAAVAALRRLRGRKLLAAAVALAVAAATLVTLPPTQPAEAQTPTIVSLVKNTGQSGRQPNNLHPSIKNAQAFTTGSNDTGYTLTSIGIYLQITSGSPTAELWSDNGSGRPGSKLQDLTTPASLATGVVSFAAPSDTTLAASTTYHVVLTGPATVARRGALSGNEDSGGAAGWSIADVGSQTNFGGSTWSAGSVGILQIDVKGYANPLPTTFVSNTGQTAGSTSDFVTDWYYALAFTTGSNAQGYTLTSIGVDLQIPDTFGAVNLAALKAEVWSDNSGLPNMKLWDLTTPSSVSTGVVSFAAPTNTTLAASTTYHIAMTGNSGGIVLTSSTNEDSGAAAGWSIADAATSYVFGEWSASSNVDLRIQVKGFAKQTTSTMSTTATTAPSTTMASSTTVPVSTTMAPTTTMPAAQSTDATLSALTGATSTDGSSFSGSLTLDPAFASATTAYIATVANGVTHLKVTPTANESNATIEAGKGSTLAAVTSGSASSALALDVGANTINVKVTAQDGTTTKTYTIVVTRAATDSLVSNVGQATGSGGYRPSDAYVTAFTTGSNAAGYTLTGIDFHIATKTASLTDAHLGTLTASVWTSGGAALTTGLDDLGTKLADLTVPATAASVTTGPVTFAAPTGTTLAASTTYYVVIGSSAWTGGVNLLLSGTESDDEDAGAADGFSIANTGNTYTGNQFVPWTEIGTSEVLSFRVSGAARAASSTPSAPTALSSDAGHRSLALSWVAPAGTPTGYDVHYTYAPTTGTGMVANNAAATGSDASAAWVAATRGTETSPPTASQTLSGLGNGRDYRWRVRGVNGNGNGAWAFGTGTPVVALSWNGATGHTDEGFSFGQRIETSSQVAISGTLTYAVGDTNPASLTADLGTYPTTFSVNAGDQYLLMPGIPTFDDTVNEEDETFKVTINAGTGYTVGTPATIVVTIEDDDPPAAPSGLSLTAGAQKLAASWSKPVGPVTAYRLRYKVTTATDQTATTAGDPSTGWVTTTASITTTMAEITGLTNGTAYHVQVSANDGQTAQGNGWGDWSSSQSGTPAAAATAGVTVSATSLAIAADGTATYTVALDTAPTANVTIAVTSGTTAAATVSPATLTFTTSDYAAKTVTVTGVAAGWSTIAHTATSTDTNYSSIAIASVAVRVDATGTGALVGNVGQSARITGLQAKTSQGFTTGSNAGGYTLASIGIDLNVGSGTPTFDVDLYSDSSGNPGTKIADLTAPPTLATGVIYFAAPSGTTLTASTTYHVVLVGSAGTFIYPTTRDAEDSGGAAGWTIADVFSEFDTTGSTWTADAFGDALRVQVKGAAKTATATAGVTVSATSVSVVAGSTTTYTIKLNKAPTADVTVTPTSGDTDKATVTNQAKTFTSTNWSQTQTVTVTGVAAGSSTITHAATSTDTAYSGISIASVAATVTAATQTAPTTLALTTNAASNTIAEDGGSVTVTATLNRAATTAVSVTLTATGTATGTADYSLPSAFTIAVGQTSATGTVTIVDDDLDEDNETVILTTSVSGLTVTGVTLTITDDDTAGVSVSQTSRSVEVGATTTYTVVLDSKPTANVVVGATSGTPANATVSPASRTFTPQNWDTAQTFTITGVQVGSSTITHAATSTDTNYPSTLSIGSVTASVVASSKTFRIESTKTANEGANARLTVTLGQAAPAGGLALAVTYDYSGSTATADDTGTTPATLTITQGQTTGTLTIPIAQDSLVEGDETFTATISTSVSGWEKVSGEDAATITITDDDDNNAQIAFGNAFTATAKQNFTVRENVTGGVLTVPVILSGLPGAETTFKVTVETGGTATEWQSTSDPGDFRIQTKSVTFTSTGSRQQNITIAITDDALLEENQTIELKISDSTSGTIGALYQRNAMSRLARVTITDDERTGAKVAFGTNVDSTSLNRVTVEEDVSGGSLNVPVIINRIPESSVTIPVTVLTVSSNAASEWQSTSDPGDFRIVTKSVTFGPSDMLSSGTVSKNLAITINDDDLVEEDQAIRVWIGDNTSTQLGRHYTRANGGRETRVTIEDDEADEGKIAFALPVVHGPGSRAEFEGTVAENVTNGVYNLPVLVSAKPESDVTVNISVVSAGTTATSADYTIATSSVTFGPGTTTDQNMVITITNDMLLEEHQTIKLRLAAAGSGLDRFYVRDTEEQDDTDGVSSEATLTILDEEQPGKIAFGTNASGTSAYTAAVDEDDGTISVPVTITDLPESSTQFTVEVLAASTATEWTNAQNPGDYRVLNNKAVTFRPTDTGKTQNVRIQLQDNALVEHPETVRLRIVAADTTPNDLGDHYDRHAQSRLATLTINDDDAAAAQIAIGTNAASMTKFTDDVDEDVTNGIYKIPIKVSHSPSVDTTFELQVLGTGTATGSGTDYSIATKTFTLTPTTTSATVDVTLTDDAWVEDDQTIEVRIKAADASGTTLEKYYTRHASGSLGTITIEDDEQRAAKVAFGTAARTTRYTADGEEVVGTLNVPIAINHLPESNTTFTVEVLSTGTARETDDPNNAMGNPKDFVIGTKTVTFGAATAKSMNLAIAIENDDVEEDDEYLDLRIVAKDTTVDDLGDHYDRGGSETAVGAGATARVTVKSEDEVSSVKFTTNITGTAGVQGGDIPLFEGQELVVTATADKYVGPGGWKVALTLRGWRSSITASPNDVTLPTFTIPEGAKTATGTITIVTDTSTEPQELFHFGGNAKRKSRTIQASPQWTRARITDSGAGLTLSTTTLDLLPTEELTYTVRLNQAPTANVTVTPASSATGKATVSSALTFTSTNWETPQPVTVTGVAAGSATITHTVTSTDTAYTNLSNLPRLTARVTAAATTFALLVKESGLSTATAEEGDTVVLELTADTIAPSGGTQFNAVWTETPDPIVGTVGVTASHTALTVTASGAGNTSTYTVRLNTQPTASVTITPTSGAPANATVSPASRTFTTSNWATPQEFTVTGVLAGSSTITHAVTSTDTSYDGATIDDVTVTVAASAVTPGGLTLSTNAPMNRVNEGGSLLVIARLNQAAPTGGTTVTLTVDSASTAETTDYNLPTTISIAAGKTTGSVTLTTRQDNDPDNETIVLTVAATSPTLSGTGLTVTIVDDERGVTVTVPEGKRRVDASIGLPDDSTPSVGVKRITVRGSGPSMWTARSGKGSVRISYTDDDGGEATVAFGNNAARNNAYQATVMEDVSGGTLTVPVTVSAAVDEAMTFTVRVLPDSTAREASSCPATPTATQDFRIANKTVTIAAGQTSTNLTIQICNDAFGEPNETIRLGFTPAPATARNVEDLFQRRPAGNLQAVITIDSEDVPTSVRLAAGAFQDATGSEGGQVEMRATLDQPADQGGVTVTLTLKSGVASTATSADYRLPAAFTIPAGETSATAVVRLLTDEVADGEKVLRLTATTSPSLTVTFATPPNPALATNVLLNRQYVEIVIRDADSPGLNLSRSSLTVAAGQQSEPYTVRLNSRPTATVTVALAVDPAANATVSPTTLTFTTQNWRTVQPVRVRGRTVGAATVTATATSTDANYNGRTATLALRVTAPTSTPSPPPPPPPPGPAGGGGPPPPGPTGGGGGEPTDDEPTGDEPTGDEPVGGFSDLDRAGRSHIVAVTNLVSRGVLDRTGCGGGQLCPREPIRRWEMAVWLVRIIDGQDPAQPTEPRFADVGTDLWWAGHAERLAELGITLGCSTEPLEYCPDRPVTRAQMASFLVRAFEIAAAEVAGFEDTADNTHRANIDALAAAGITLGCATDPPSFCPRDPTTRAQMASFLTRVLETREPTPTG